MHPLENSDEMLSRSINDLQKCGEAQMISLKSSVASLSCCLNLTDSTDSTDSTDLTDVKSSINSINSINSKNLTDLTDLSDLTDLMDLLNFSTSSYALISLTTSLEKNSL